MRIPRLQPSIAVLLCCAQLICMAPVSQAQDEEPPIQAPLKSWYPRLTGLPYTLEGEEILLLNRQKYLAPHCIVSFFEGTSEEQKQEILQLFPTYEIHKTEDSRTYECILTSVDHLFMAVDAYNDHPLVQEARLLRYADGDSSVTPSPIFTPGGPQSNVEQKGVESLRPGDLNQDYAWTVMDAVIALRGIVGLDDLSPFMAAQADVDRSGQPDVMDAVTILRLCLGMSLPPPYGYAAE